MALVGSQTLGFSSVSTRTRLTMIPMLHHLMTCGIMPTRVVAQLLDHSPHWLQVVHPAHCLNRFAVMDDDIIMSDLLFYQEVV